VVRACQRLGFQSPLDARWCRLSHILTESIPTPDAQGGPAVLATGRPGRMTCTCGEPIPGVDKYAITFVLEKVGDYLLGQCRRCGTIFWAEG
jgi:hypothetical protein